MFNIASIRDSILKKIGSSESGDSPAADTSSQPHNTDDAVGSSTTAFQKAEQNGQSTLASKNTTLHSGDINFSGSETGSQQQVTEEADNSRNLEDAQFMLKNLEGGEKLPCLPASTVTSGFHESEKNGNTSKQAQNTASDCELVADMDNVSSTIQRLPDSINRSVEMTGCDHAAGKLVSDETNLTPAVSHDSDQCEEDRGDSDAFLQEQADTGNTSQEVVIKTEIIDEGYEQHLTNPALSSFSEVHENIEGFENVFVKKEGGVGDDDAGRSDDVVLLGVGYRNPYSDSEDDSDTDTSSMSSFEVFEKKKERCRDEEPQEEVVEARTKGEMYPEDLPPIEDLQISISNETELIQIGTVSGIVGVLVVIQSTVLAGGQVLPVNEDTVFFFEDRRPFGTVFEVFGPTRTPFYSVRFNSREDIDKKGVEVGLKLYFAPSEQDLTHFVFLDSLLRLKGSDASWKDNNEPPPSMVDYSDDEDEKRAKAKRKGGKNYGNRDEDSTKEWKRNKHTEGGSENGNAAASSDPHQKTNNQPQHASRGRGGFRRGGRGGGSFVCNSYDGQGSQRPPACANSSNGPGFLQPARFTGPGSGMPSGQSPMFSGPPGQMGFQHQAFSGHSRMPPHQQQQMFSVPGNGMPPYQPPPFPVPNGGNYSRPPPMFWNNNNNNNNAMQPPQPPVFPGSAQHRPPFAQWAPNHPY